VQEVSQRQEGDCGGADHLQVPFLVELAGHHPDRFGDAFAVGDLEEIGGDDVAAAGASRPALSLMMPRSSTTAVVGCSSTNAPSSGGACFDMTSFSWSG
jgi:hypothetical protein